ncbi:MAG TPA: tetratricopeptide repeat protein [Chitinophagaceae bacterium]|nr:tetratricopeptide repeat protein [Chitinophagaceae bacterium]
MNKRPVILFVLYFAGLSAVAQPRQRVDSLFHVTTAAVPVAEKIKAYGTLAELYYVYQNDDAGDSMLQRQLRLAELSGNKELILPVLFGDAITNVNKWRSTETFNKALEFFKKGLEYSKAISREDYLALAYVRLATFYRISGKLEDAFYNANTAFTSSLNIDNDSIKIITAIELGDTYQARGESLLAYKAYINAFDRAVGISNSVLQSEVYHRYSTLYRALGNKEQSIENLMKSLELNEKNHNDEALIKDNIDLAKYTDELEYIQRALAKSESLRLDKYILASKRLMYGYYSYVVGNSDSTINYINTNTDLKETFLNSGEEKYFWSLGSVYHYGAKPGSPDYFSKLDSAISYFKKAEPGFEKNFDAKTCQALYEEMGECYELKGQTVLSIQYYDKAYSLLGELKDPKKESFYDRSLSGLYEQLGDYKKAFTYSKKADQLKDSLQKLSNQRDIAMVEVSNEKKNHEKQLELIAQKKITKRNLQYMGITIAITMIFVMLIVIGMFPISPLTIKILGYFAFISLFEFIVLLLDNFLHDIAHGEPLKIWLMKIFLIALLVPFQHYLEKGLLNFIHSKKLHRVRKKLSIKKWWPSWKKSTAATIDKVEEDTAVL